MEDAGETAARARSISGRGGGAAEEMTLLSSIKAWRAARRGALESVCFSRMFSFSSPWKEPCNLPKFHLQPRRWTSRLPSPSWYVRSAQTCLDFPPAMAASRIYAWLGRGELPCCNLL